MSAKHLCSLAADLICPEELWQDEERVAAAKQRYLSRNFRMRFTQPGTPASIMSGDVKEYDAVLTSDEASVICEDIMRSDRTSERKAALCERVRAIMTCPTYSEEPFCQYSDVPQIGGPHEPFDAPRSWAWTKAIFSATKERLDHVKELSNIQEPDEVSREVLAIARQSLRDLISMCAALSESINDSGNLYAGYVYAATAASKPHLVTTEEGSKVHDLLSSLSQRAQDRLMLEALRMERELVSMAYGASLLAGVPDFQVKVLKEVTRKKRGNLITMTSIIPYRDSEAEVRLKRISLPQSRKDQLEKMPANEIIEIWKRLGSNLTLERLTKAMDGADNTRTDEPCVGSQSEAAGPSQIVSDTQPEDQSKEGLGQSEPSAECLDKVNVKKSLKAKQLRRGRRGKWAMSSSTQDDTKEGSEDQTRSVDGTAPELSDSEVDSADQIGDRELAAAWRGKKPETSSASKPKQNSVASTSEQQTRSARPTQSSFSTRGGGYKKNPWKPRGAQHSFRTQDHTATASSSSNAAPPQPSESRELTISGDTTYVPNWFDDLLPQFMRQPNLAFIMADEEAKAAASRDRRS